MLLPTIAIIAVNLALGFLAAIGRERMLALRAAGALAHAGLPAASPPEPVDSEPADPATSASPVETRPPGPSERPSADQPVAEHEDAATAPLSPGASEPNGEPVGDATVDSHANEPALEAFPEPSAGDVEGNGPAPPSDVNDANDANDDDSNDDDVSREQSASAEFVDECDEPPQAVDVASATAKANADLPGEWFELLADIEQEGYGKCQSFVEASTQVLRLEVGRYRSELVAIDVRLRAIFADFSPQALQAALADLDRVNADWLARQGEAVGHLSARRDQLGDLRQAGQRLEDVLLEQTAQIESSRTNLQQIDVAAGRDALRRRVLVELGRLLDMAHALRDQLQEALLAIVIGENRIPSLDRRLHVDALTGFVNRTGLEVVLYEWWRDDPRRIRPLSLVMFDVVRTARFNERHGAAVGDAMLAAVGKIVDGALRKKRGCDLVARQNGQRFIVMLADTGPHNATSAAERIRQSIAASTFEIAGENVQVSASCGVVEVTTDDDGQSLVRRLEAATALAKKLGRNQTCLDRGAGPAAIENPPDYQVKGKIVRLDS